MSANDVDKLLIDAMRNLQLLSYEACHIEYDYMKVLKV